MRFLAVVLLNLSLVLSSAGAGEERPLAIGLMLPGLGTDGGWNQLAKVAAEKIAKDTGAKLAVIQKVSQDKAGDELRDFAAQGFSLVIAHGYEFLNPAAEVAKSLPRLNLAVSGADVAKPGIVTLDFDLSQASWQVGVLAARVSTRGRIGYLGGAKIPSVLACLRGFIAGAKSVNPEIKVIEAYPGWDQPAQAKAQTEALLRLGTDVIFQNVDAASRGVFEAIREAAAKGQKVWAIGSCADQNANPIAAERTLASAVIHLEVAFRRLAESTRAGTFKPGLVGESLASGACVTVLNPALLGTVITPAVQAEVEAVGKRLAAGELKVPPAE